MPEIAIQTAGGTRERYPLAKGRVTIGRSRESDIFLPDQWLSRHHAAIEERAEGYWVSDLKSKNGTLLNGEPVRDWRRLRPGDVITLGEHTLTFCTESAEEDEEEREPEGTRVFSVKELSAINTRPAIDPSELQRQNRVLTILSKAASELVVHRPLDELFELVLDLLLEAVGAERGAILLLEGGPPHPVIRASRSRSGDPLDPREPLDRAAGHGGAGVAPPAERARGRALQERGLDPRLRHPHRDVRAPVVHRHRRGP